jgi:hypothetical protein
MLLWMNVLASSGWMLWSMPELELLVVTLRYIITFWVYPGNVREGPNRAGVSKGMCGDRREFIVYSFAFSSYLSLPRAAFWTVVHGRESQGVWLS